MKGDGSFSLGSETWPGLGKVIEETSELNVELAKLIATYGSTDYWGGRNLRVSVIEEVADALASIQFFARQNFTDEELDQIDNRSVLKFIKYTDWREAKDG